MVDKDPVMPTGRLPLVALMMIAVTGLAIGVVFTLGLRDGALMGFCIAAHEASITASYALITLHVAAAVADADMVRFLVKQGLGVDMPDCRMNTPLHAAAKSNTAEVVSLLLGYGADAMLKNSEGHTPLSLAQIKARSSVVK